MPLVDHSRIDHSRIDPWRIELIVVRDGAYGPGERSAIARDVERRLLLRLWRGVIVERAAFEAMEAVDQHVVRMRALTAISPGPQILSHWSAAVLHGLPVLDRRLRTVHTTVPDPDARGRLGTTGHVFPLDSTEVVQVNGLLATGIARTVVDIAGGGPMEEGVMAADAALRLGVPREVLEAAVDLAGPRRSSRRIGAAVAFGHPGAESANESWSRVTMLRIGIEPPELQHRMVLPDGSEVFLDFYFPTADAGGEADGATKYLNPAYATEGAGKAVYDEKLREDAVRARLRALARWGWTQSGSAPLLRPVLARAGVGPSSPRATLVDYCASARGAIVRFVARRSQVRR